jgi:hypothetical protein
MNEQKILKVLNMKIQESNKNGNQDHDVIWKKERTRKDNEEEELWGKRSIKWHECWMTHTAEIS